MSKNFLWSINGEGDNINIFFCFHPGNVFIEYCNNKQNYNNNKNDFANIFVHNYCAQINDVL